MKTVEQDSTSLTDIARRVGPKKEYLKTFLPRYEQLFAPLRDKPITLLETGVGGYRHLHSGGGSLRMWAEFLPNATIAGLDVHPKQLEMPPNVTVHCGSQTDTELLRGLVGHYGGFDVVIDDASHVTAKTVATFDVPWPYTRRLYVVEDLHMAKAKGTAEYFKQVDGADLETLNMCVVTR